MQETIWTRMKMKKTLKQNLTVNHMYYNICKRHVLFIIVALEGYIQQAKRQRLSLTKKKKNPSEKHESSLFSQQLMVIILTAHFSVIRLLSYI